MNDAPENLVRLFTAVSAGHAPGNCEECRAWLPALVEAELADEDITSQFPAILTHLDTCEDCDAEHAALLDLALMEARGQLPEPTTYPEVKLPWEIRLRRLVRETCQAVLEVIDKDLVQELSVVAQAFFEQASGAPDRLELQAATLPMGLGSLGTETLPVLMATYYSLTTMLDAYSLPQLQAFAEEGKLELQLRQIARKEARRHKLRGRTQSDFVDRFAGQILADIPALLSLASDQDPRHSS